MVERPLRILQVSTSDIVGGAAWVAWNLFRAYRQDGLPSWLAVGHKCSDDPDVLLVPNGDYRSMWARTCLTVENMLSPLVGRVRGAWRLRSWLHLVGQFRRHLEIQRGHEDFDFPGTWQLLDLLPERPDIVNCHNLHGNYFDLGAIPWLSQQIPTILTLHDAWLLSGHCAHSLECEKWRNGCGECPDLKISPSIARDATAYNWRRKRDIYARSQLYVATPCQWLMDKVEQSILAPAIVEARVIPNGVDLTIFHPGDQREARTVLGIQQDAKMLLFVANATKSNPWKDYATLEKTVKRVAESLPDERIILVYLGVEQNPERIGRAEVRFIRYRKDPLKVARFYQAADAYLHAARVETFPNAVLEALACGTPVVATAVGGIPAQVKGLRTANLNGYKLEEATGVLVPPEDAKVMAKAIITLLTDDALRMHLGNNAAEDAQRHFDLNRQVGDYIGWYQEILENWQH